VTWFRCYRNGAGRRFAGLGPNLAAYRRRAAKGEQAQDSSVFVLCGMDVQYHSKTKDKVTGLTYLTVHESKIWDGERCGKDEGEDGIARLL